jgi:hypothetical protein
MPEPLTILELRTPKDSEETPEAAAQLFAAVPTLPSTLWQKLTNSQQAISFEIMVKNQYIYFFCACPQSTQPYLESQLTAAYPTLVITHYPEDYLPQGLNQLPHPQATLLSLTRASYLPLKTYVDFKNVDPLATILGNLAKAESEDTILIQFLVLPASDSWKQSGYSTIEKGIPQKDGTRREHPQKHLIEQKLAQTGLRVGIKIFASSASATRTKNWLSTISGSFGSVTNAQGNSLKLLTPLLGKNRLLRSIPFRTLEKTPKQYLTVDELATLWHLPNLTLSTIKNIAWGKTLLGEPPENLPVFDLLPEAERQEVNLFARTEFKNQSRIFGIKRPDRRKHLYVIGKTGTGKSTLLANMAINDLKHNEGVAVIDPHGDLCEILLDFIPAHRINDVVYFNPTDPSHTVKLNVFETSSVEHKELIASGILAIFQKLYYYSWGPRLEHILRNTLLTLLSRPETTLPDVVRILTDKKFRSKIVGSLEDQVLKQFWTGEFETMGERLRAEAVSPILNKVGQFIASPLIRNVLDSPDSSFSIEQVMNEGKILIANLSQGKLGEDNSSLLGAMLITRIQLASMSRVNVPEEQRKDFYLYVDEFQNFATTSFIKILSEARKYRLSLTLANQYIAQIPEDVQKAIFGNAGSLITFTIGANDANVMHHEFAAKYKQEDLVSLGQFQTIVKLAIDGQTSLPFPATTLPLAASKNQNRDKVIRVSRERYAKKK